MTVRTLAMILALAGIVLSGAAFAKESVSSCFDAGRLGSCDRRVLQHVEFKSVVLQFVDPEGTELGEGLSRLLWREILESISDLAGAGVILAYDRAGQIEEALGEADLGSFLQRAYHDAALSIAAQQDAQMAIWGAVLPDGDEVYVQLFVTLRDTADKPWTTFSLAIEEPVRARLSTSLGRSRLNLPAVRGSRQVLVGGRYVVRCALDAGCPEGIDLRGGPSNDAPVVAHVPAGDAVEVVDMRRQWLEVAGPTPGWVNLYHVEAFPRTVTFRGRRDVNLRAAPGGDRLASVDLDGAYRVLDAARHGRFDEPWYRLDVNGRQGWIAGRLTHRRSYTFPGVHLIAGLYRYGRGQYREAAGELQAFLDTVPEADNVTRAATLKFLAASRAAVQHGDPRVEQPLEDLDRALEYTPFDPGVHTLRALINAGDRAHVGAAVGDLRRALELDGGDADALEVLQRLSDAAGSDGLRRLAPREVDIEAEAGFRSLEESYLRDTP